MKKILVALALSSLVTSSVYAIDSEPILHSINKIDSEPILKPVDGLLDAVFILGDQLSKLGKKVSIYEYELKNVRILNLAVDGKVLKSVCLNCEEIKVTY